MKKILISFLSFWILVYPLFAQEDFKMYPDVPKNHWAYEAIEQLTKDGIMIGYLDKPSNTFKGDRNLTRYEFAYALYHAVNRIEENILQKKSSMEIEEFLKSQKVDPKTIEAFSLLLQEFKKEINEINKRVTILEEKNKKSSSTKLPLYFSLAALLISLVSLTISVQK